MERFWPFDFQPLGPRLPYVESIRTLRRLLDPFLIDCEASISIHRTRYFAISGGSLKNRSRSAGAGTSPRKALRRKRFLTP
jgi:hypothetical protein